MAKKSISIKVNPEVLKWAINSAGFTYSEISKKLSDKDSLVEDWLSGKNEPTLKQLEKLSHIVKRPFASFFLPKAPEEKPLPKDFRMLPNKEGKFDKKTILAIRKARSLQKTCKELSVYIGEEIKSKVEKINIEEQPEDIAKKYRDFFDLTEINQTKFKSHYEFYNFLRQKLEGINVFPFQISMPLEDARGFALSDSEPAIIVVNSKDFIEARIFTIMHEFGHVLLRETGIDLTELKSQNKIEKWCNTFSSSFLFPKEIAKRIFEENRDNLTETKTLDRLSNKYSVSKSMILYNMVQLGFIDWSKFDEILSRFKAKEQVSGNVPIERKRLAEMGNKFVSLVAGNLDKKNITYSDALGYLSIKSRKLDKLLSKAKS